MAEPEELQFELRPGDMWSGDATNERCQIAGNDTLPYDTDYWFALDFTLIGEQPEAGIWLSLFAFHQTPDTATEAIGSGPLLVAVNNGNLVVTTRYADEAEHTKTTATLHYAEPIVFGATMSFVGRIVLGKTAGGELDLWLNGSQIVNYTGRIGFNDAVGPYFKAGLYRAAGSNRTLLARLARVEVGTASLAHRV